MTPFLLFSYALALAGGLLLVGVVGILLFALALWLLGAGPVASQDARTSVRSPRGSKEALPEGPLRTNPPSGGLTGHREP